MKQKPRDNVKLSEDVLQRLDLTSYSDVIFVASDNVKIPAQRIFLASCSAVFKSIFDEKKDKIPVKIEVLNFAGVTVKQAVDLCYGREISVDGSEVELLKFAKKYHISQIKVRHFT